jgi:superfamily II DNA helicase RecQ
MMSRGIYESTSEYRNQPLERVTKALREVFRLRDWRSPQKEIINGALSCKDILVIMPAGSGKSLTYQLPAVVQDQGRVVLVVSPLLALMVDQIEQLRRVGIESVMMSSTTSREENKQDLLQEDVTSIRLIYVTPEFLVRSKVLRTNITKLYLTGRVAMFVRLMRRTVVANGVMISGRIIEN